MEQTGRRMIRAHQFVDALVGTAFVVGTIPGIVDDVRGFAEVRVLAVEVGRRQEPFETFDIGGRVTIAAFHVAASDPTGAGRYADLVAGAIVAYHRAHGMGAVVQVVARHK